MTGSPFLVLGLPRSRTYWLSQFLSYGGHQCSHEQIRHLRTMDDVKAWSSMSFIGSAETSAAPWWRTAASLRPDLRVLVIRRPVAEVVDSIMRLDMRGMCTFAGEALAESMKRLDAKLDQVEHRMPNVLSVPFTALEEEAVCAAAFEHCLQQPHDHDWWVRCAAVNLQISMPHLMQYALAHQGQMAKLATIVKRDTFARSAAGPAADLDGVTIQQEPFEMWRRDATRLFEEHLVLVGESPEDHVRKNTDLMAAMDGAGAMQIMTARSNGRMFGYLMTIIGPSLESPEIRSAQHLTFFASKEIPGLGMKLQRAANAALREKGIGEVFMRTGSRGAGRKMSAICRRIGMEELGEMYKLDLEAA